MVSSIGPDSNVPTSSVRLTNVASPTSLVIVSPTLASSPSFSSEVMVSPSSASSFSSLLSASFSAVSSAASSFAFASPSDASSPLPQAANVAVKNNAINSNNLLFMMYSSLYIMFENYYL